MTNFRTFQLPARSLADMQNLLQAAILKGDSAILEFLQDNSRTSRETLFGVYRHAYTGRLIDMLRSEYPLLARYVGYERFDEIARCYIAAYPSQTANARWFGARLPEYLRTCVGGDFTEDFVGLSQIENAVSDAFDAPDATVLDAAALGNFAPEVWSRLVFTPHPSVTLLQVAGNVFDLWRALKCEEPAPSFLTTSEKRHLVVWRSDLAPMVRELDYEEYMVLTEVRGGGRFQSLCEMLATYDDPDTAALRAAGYLHGWLAGDMLTDVRLSGDPR